MTRVFKDLHAIERDLWSAFDAHRPRPHLRRASPRHRLVDEGTSLAYHAELPGVAGDRIEVCVEGMTLRVRAERRVEAAEGFKPLGAERAATIFAQTIELSCPVDVARVTAELRAGVLTVSLPKSTEAAPRIVPVSVK
jgi:HSP20 family protein